MAIYSSGYFFTYLFFRAHFYPRSRSIIADPPESPLFFSSFPSIINKFIIQCIQTTRRLQKCVKNYRNPWPFQAVWIIVVRTHCRCAFRFSRIEVKIEYVHTVLCRRKCRWYFCGRLSCYVCLAQVYLYQSCVQSGYSVSVEKKKNSHVFDWQKYILFSIQTHEYRLQFRNKCNVVLMRNI